VRGHRAWKSANKLILKENRISAYQNYTYLGSIPSTVQVSRTIRLTTRERETLRGLLSDRPPKAIAADLGISDKTLYRHRANLMEKLGARTHGDLVRIVRERGLLIDL